MIDEIKEKIDLNKKDRKTYQEYIKAFTDSEKAREIYKDDEYFSRLTGEKIVEQKEEDEFF